MVLALTLPSKDQANNVRRTGELGLRNFDVRGILNMGLRRPKESKMHCKRTLKNSIWLLFAVLCAAASPPQLKTLEIDTGQSKVQYTVDTTFHTVHGTFQLKPGSIQFDPAGGPASGQLVVNASSGESGSKGRDKKMTNEVLEANKFPNITFTAQQTKGALALSGGSQIQLEGTLSLHGQSHPMTLDVKADVQGTTLSGDTAFDVPYTQWGLKNPGNFFLHVNDKVEIHVHIVGQVKAVATAPRK